MARIPVITIDGASGTGKGTVTHIIAKKLGWGLLDSGVLYRVLAYAAEKHGVSLEDEAGLADLAEHLDISFISPTVSDPPRILYAGSDVTALIRTEKMGNAASKAGTFPIVRTALLARQRAFRISPGLITDGRDMGTVVFPDADLKIFLRASPEERASRRYNQLKEIGIHANLSDLVQELKERDRRDEERTHAPLKPAEDAICIDTDHLTIDEVVEKVMVEIRAVVKKA
jgi:cytidylate kinase